MKDRVDTAIGATFGSAVDRGASKQKQAYNSDFWRNEELRSQIVPNVLDKTKYQFDYDIADSENGIQLDREYAQKRFRVVSIRSSLLIERELRPDGVGARLKDRIIKQVENENGVHTAGIFEPTSPEAVAAIRQDRTDELALALKHKPDVVSFCEFALPPTTFCDVDGNCYDYFDGELDGVVDDVFVKDAQSIRDSAMAKAGVEKYPFIFYGSAHCTESLYNIGVVSPGGELENAWRLDTQRSRTTSGLGEYEDFTPISGKGPIIHRKRAPARRVGELARVPSDIGFRQYRTPLGRICVLICSDVIDLNQYANIVRLNTEWDNMSNYDRIRLVLVPAYNFSTVLETTCQDLSLAARTNVLLTNARGQQLSNRTGDAKTLPGSKMYFMGHDIEDLDPRESSMFSYEYDNDDNHWIVDIDIEEQDRVLDITRPSPRNPMRRNAR